MQRGQVYRCNVCGSIVQLLHVGGGSLVCCGQPMELLPEKTEDAGFEKHVPVIKKVEGGVRVKVGSIPHPMEEAHFIEWISILVDEKIYTRFLDGLRELNNEEAILRVKEIIKKRRKLDINYARDLREENLGGPGETQLWWFEKWY